MSADYDRLFHSSGDAVQTAEEESDRGTAPHSGTATPIPTSGPGRREVTPPPMPVAPAKTQAAPAPPPRQTEVTTQMPPTRTAGPQRQPNGMMRAPLSTGPAGARFEQPRSAPTPPPRPVPAPAPSQHFAESQSEANGSWRTAGSSASQPATTSAATIGNHRAIDALSH